MKVIRSGSACAGAAVLAVALVMANVSMRGAEAQSSFFRCHSEAGANAPINDVGELVQKMFAMPVTATCCMQLVSEHGNPCSVVATSGNAAAIICGAVPIACRNCTRLAERLQQLVEECSDNANGVQGVAYSTHGTSLSLIYLTSSSKHPY